MVRFEWFESSPAKTLSGFWFHFQECFLLWATNQIKWYLDIHFSSLSDRDFKLSPRSEIPLYLRTIAIGIACTFPLIPAHIKVIHYWIIINLSLAHFKQSIFSRFKFSHASARLDNQINDLLCFLGKENKKHQQLNAAQRHFWNPFSNMLQYFCWEVSRRCLFFSPGC